MRKTILGLLGFSSIGILAISCADWSDDSCAGGVCDSSNMNSWDGGTIDEEKSLFVDASGKPNTGDGSKANPFTTIGAALINVLNDPTKFNIYVCGNGKYLEDIELGAGHHGVGIYGGRTCGDWQPSKDSPVIGKGTIALKTNSASSIIIGSVQLVAASAAVPGGSSIGALVTNNSSVTFQNVSITAGSGKTGDNGTLKEYSFSDLPSPNGKSATDAAHSGDATSITCPGPDGTNGLTTVGGAGGGSNAPGQSGQPPTVESGGTVAGCSSATHETGGSGASGSSPAAAGGATSYGELSENGWAPKAGGDGAPGEPGQGGGGGAAPPNGAGGGGGAGGCGGAGAKGGMGGGGSIALAILQSSVSASNLSLKANDAGSGGDGVQGQSEQQKADGTAVSGTAGGGSGGGCFGGAGGRGGRGAASGGGAGGISVGVLLQGTTSIPDGITSNVFGAPGSGGKSPGNPGDPKIPASGKMGVAQKTLSL